MKTIVIAAIFMITAVYLCAVEFENLSGSDLMLGIGARQIALGGAGTLLDDAPGSIYWNAAKLADLGKSQLHVDFETPHSLKNFIVIISPKIFHIGSKRFAIGIGIINRLRIIGESDEIWTGYAAHLLDLTFTSLADFQGKIDSNTNDYRFSFAIQATEKLNIGATFVRLT